jgi:hypothetical protein
VSSRCGFGDGSVAIISYLVVADFIGSLLGVMDLFPPPVA